MGVVHATRSLPNGIVGVSVRVNLATYSLWAKAPSVPVYRGFTVRFAKRWRRSAVAVCKP